MYRRILLPLDGSTVAEHALPHAIAVAKQFQAELILLKVIEPPPGETILSTKNEEFSETWSEHVARRYLGRIATQVHQQGVLVNVVTVKGSAAEKIVQFAEKADVDMIAMSTHARSGLDKLVLGSVTEGVLHTTDIPVLAVHPVLRRRKSELPIAVLDAADAMNTLPV